MVAAHESSLLLKAVVGLVIYSNVTCALRVSPHPNLLLTATPSEHEENGDCKCLFIGRGAGEFYTGHREAK